jgi:hypothetical protein
LQLVEGVFVIVRSLVRTVFGFVLPGYRGFLVIENHHGLRTTFEEVEEANKETHFFSPKRGGVCLTPPLLVQKVLKPKSE